MLRTERVNATFHGRVDEIHEAFRSGGPIIQLHPEDNREFDAIFVGGGAGGRFGSAYMRAMGGRQLTIDSWPFLGGSCPHNACVPHHVFSDCAAELDLMRWFSGQLFFPDMTGKQVSIKQIVDFFKDGRIGAHGIMNYQSAEQLDMEFILNARAMVLDAHTVEVLGQRYTAKNLILGLGALPIYPDVPGIDLKGIYTNVDLVETLAEEPRQIVVVGGGKTAVEYGCFFRACGRETTLVTRSRMFADLNLDHSIREYVLRNMTLRGMTLMESTPLVEVLGDESGHVRAAVVETPDGRLELPCDFLFLATGLRPVSDEIAQTLGLETGPRGEVVVNSRQQTNVPNVYAIGDLTGPPYEMWRARKGGMVAARNCMGEEVHHDMSHYPDFLHTTYEVSWLGLTEEQARAQYPNVIVIQMPPDGLWDIPLPVADRTMLYAFRYPELSGFQKCIIDGDSRRVVGMHHVGHGAKDAFQYLDWMIHTERGFTIDDMADLKELFLNPDHFIQLCRLRAGHRQLINL